MTRMLLVLTLAALMAPAAAELYRYRDPITGQMKLTNIPPPGTKNVQQPPAAATPAAFPPQATAAAPPAKPGATLPPNAFEMDRQRVLLLQQLVAEAPNVGTPAGRERFLARLGDVVSIETRLDRLDPAGRKGREVERDRALELCSDGFAQALKDPNAQVEFAGELLRFMGDRIVQCARGLC
ncbi:MAG TPA: DUF4124 domain-containing protein [Burkholderiales bacterium]|nr:DUF4124 domain-containing protein [Burkholderiales bacterium]